MNTRSLRFASLLTALAVVTAACGGNGTNGASASGPTTTADQAAQRLAGRYAHYDVVAYQSTLLKTLIISYGFTDLAVKDGVLTATESFCHADQRSDQPIETSISDAATSAIRPVPTPVTLSTKDGRSRIQRPETPTGVGIHLAEPANDVLPTDPDDPRIADDDHDGHPGITVHVKVSGDLQGDLFIARREIFAYDVLAQDDGSLTGTVSDHSEQLIVGATNEMFVSRSAWTQYPDLTKSPIILKPVQQDWDCARLMAARDDLFPPAPVVDW